MTKHQAFINARKYCFAELVYDRLAQVEKVDGAFFRAAYSNATKKAKAYVARKHWEDQL